MIDFKEEDGAIFFAVRVVPRASKSEIVGGHDKDLKVRIAAPPVEGAANAELVRLLSKTIGVSGSAVEILSGQASKTKRIKISGVSSDDFLKKIGV